jgi:GNAT superfamily N-acetyltransferase
MSYTIVPTFEGREEDRAAILEALLHFNRAHVPDVSSSPLGLLLRSNEGEVVGGLWGRFAYDWLFVEILVIPEELRGQGLGSRLLGQAETMAAERGCMGVWLDTFTFQARPFYEKLGYEVVGELKDRPRGSSHIWLAKRFSE